MIDHETHVEGRIIEVGGRVDQFRSERMFQTMRLQTVLLGGLQVIAGLILVYAILSR